MPTLPPQYSQAVLLQDLMKSAKSSWILPPGHPSLKYMPSCVNNSALLVSTLNRLASNKIEFMDTNLTLKNHHAEKPMSAHFNFPRHFCFYSKSHYFPTEESQKEDSNVIVQN